MKVGFKMNELVLQLPFPNKAQMKTSCSFNPEILGYEDSSLDDITAIVLVVFLFNGFNVSKNKVHANPSALFLLLILILLRYSNRIFPLDRTEEKYVQSDEYNSNTCIRDKEIKEESPYLGGYEPGYSDCCKGADSNFYEGGSEGGCEGGYEGGNVAGYENEYDCGNKTRYSVQEDNFNQGGSDEFVYSSSESDTVEEVIFSYPQEAECLKNDNFDCRFKNLKK